jgi:hypothetical protein
VDGTMIEMSWREAQAIEFFRAMRAERMNIADLLT